jgi:hypothetical protein
VLTVVVVDDTLVVLVVIVVVVFEMLVVVCKKKANRKPRAGKTRSVRIESASPLIEHALKKDIVSAAASFNGVLQWRH